MYKIIKSVVFTFLTRSPLHTHACMHTHTRTHTHTHTHAHMHTHTSKPSFMLSEDRSLTGLINLYQDVRVIAVET